MPIRTSYLGYFEKTHLKINENSLKSWKTTFRFILMKVTKFSKILVFRQTGQILVDQYLDFVWSNFKLHSVT